MDPITTVSLLLNGVSFVTVLVTVTIAVMRTKELNTSAKQIQAIVEVMDEMKCVDSGLLDQIHELKGATTADIMLINERIMNITKLLEEIKSIVMRRP
jgi:hypothetical protein